jgi:hypothetical protein
MATSYRKQRQCGRDRHTVLLVVGLFAAADTVAARRRCQPNRHGRDVRGDCVRRKSVVLEIMENRGKTRMTSSVIQAALKKKRQGHARSH